MKDIVKETVKLIIDEENLFEMANLVGKHTGLGSVIIWSEQYGSKRNVEHNTPRLKSHLITPLL